MLAIPIHHANSLVFVDPYVDPTVWRYADFFRLLEPLRSRPQKPVLQVHCAADRVGSNPLSLVQLVERFRTLEDALLSWNLKLTVYFWNRRTFRGGFHDRFLITDLGAFGCSNGFEVSPQTKMRVWLLPQADGRELQLQLSENYQRPERILEVGVGVVAGVDARRR